MFVPVQWIWVMRAYTVVGDMTFALPFVRYVFAAATPAHVGTFMRLAVTHT